MSDSGILALRPAKEGLHQIGQFLDPVQSAERQPLHFILSLLELRGNLAFGVGPDLLIRIQMGRVRRRRY